MAQAGGAVRCGPSELSPAARFVWGAATRPYESAGSPKPRRDRAHDAAALNQLICGVYFLSRRREQETVAELDPIRRADRVWVLGELRALIDACAEAAASLRMLVMEVAGVPGLGGRVVVGVALGLACRFERRRCARPALPHWPLPSAARRPHPLSAALNSLERLKIDGEGLSRDPPPSPTIVCDFY